jgi:hypothetical protein
MRLFAQGDLLFKRVDDALQFAAAPESPPEAAIVLAHGEKSGHCHTLQGRLSCLREESAARDVPSGLYIGHVRVAGSALLTHQEHAAIALAEGTYRVRRQRVLDPADAAVVED